MAEQVVARPRNLPVGPLRGKGIGWNGLVTMIASEGALFAYLLFSYYYCGANNPPPWVQEVHPSLKLAGPNTVILLLSSLAAWSGERGVGEGNRTKALAGSGVALLLGTVFAVIQVFEWKAKHFGLGASSYASLYYVTTGFHIAHVVVGLVVLLMLFLWTMPGWFSRNRRIVYTCGSWYWHFVDAVWLLVFFTYYVTPYLGFGT